MTTKIDLGSPQWALIKEWAQTELRSAHESLANAGVSERDADVLRGRIAALRDLGKFAKPRGDEPFFNEPAKEYF